ncbi:MAG: argininosuccinate lyase [Kangiellaceae bacterium]|nr:argininosuccinate lyase [Kangiellaceae bacterium]
MSAPIWQKQSAAKTDEAIMQYMAGEDIILDRILMPYDILASKAHASGLQSIGVLSEEELIKLKRELDNLSLALAQGDFTLDSQFEDCHSAIEFYLTEKLGNLGKKIHTGRSRNDQVAVATRLYLKDSLSTASEYVSKTIIECLAKAEATKNIAMPGYTHLQRAVPSSCGMWFASFAEAMIDNLASIKHCSELIDSNPLGTAAGYGVNLPLNRELTTKELGFGRAQINPIYAQNSRGKFEIAVLNSLAQCMLDVRRYSWDLSLFTTQEFNFVSLPDEMTTGSSIMPNKRNPDLIELMRASYASVQAAIVEIQSLLSLPSGYQRDLQFSKGPMIRGITQALQTLCLFSEVVKETEFIADNLNDAIDTPMYATDFAVELSSQGIPFRDAYQNVVARYSELESRTPADSLAQRTSFGACAQLGILELKMRFESLK